MEPATPQHTTLPVPKKTYSFFPKKTEPPFFSPAFIQPKLSVGPVDDAYEREADNVAERVMRMPDHTSSLAFFSAVQPISKVQRCAAYGAEEQLQRQEEDDEEPLQTKRDSGFDVQRQCAACEREDNMIQPKAVIQRKCAACEEEEHQPLQMKRNGSVQLKEKTPFIQRKCATCEAEDHAIQPKSKYARPAPVDPFIQRKCAACEEEDKQLSRKASALSSVPAVTPSVHQALNSPGRPMDKSTRSFMESRFGYDFGNVRIHDDVAAHQSSKDIHAFAYTHGKHVVFGPGQYQPGTIEGKKLLAHELTHVVQQGAQRSPAIQRQLFLGQGGGYRGLMQRDRNRVQQQMNNPPDPGKNKCGNYYPPTPFRSVFAGKLPSNPYVPVINIQHKQKFEVDPALHDYFLYFFAQGLTAPVNIKYGDWGEGNINVYPTRMAFDENCEKHYYFIPLGMPPTLPIPIPHEECTCEFNIEKSGLNATAQSISLTLPDLDTKEKNGTNILAIEIKDNVISGRVGWLDGTPKDNVDPSDEARADYRLEAFLPFIFGKDYTGHNFDLFNNFYNNKIGDAGIILNCLGKLSLANQQSMFAAFQSGDSASWGAILSTQIMGAEDHNLSIDRTPQGELAGEDDGIKISAEWGDKKFDAVSASLHASYVNSKLNVHGKANYKSDRAQGELFIAVTDYATAKKYAMEYLPDDIAALAAADKPGHETERLAFVGAGRLKFILFDGKKKPGAEPKRKKGSIIEKEDKKEHNDQTVKVDASFVVEPEGYITVAGLIKQPETVYTLFDEMTYKGKIPILSVPVADIPLPIPGTYCEFDIAIRLEFGAHIGPLELSQLSISGIYSNRPGATKELELAGNLKLKAGVFADLVFELSASVGAGPFTIEVISKKITFGASMSGIVTARPTIGIRSSDKDPSKPRDYYFKGNFDFDASGKLSYEITDRFKANAEEKTDDKSKTPDEYTYISNTATNEKNIHGKDVDAPMDHSLGSEEPPDFISAEKLAGMNLNKGLNHVIKDRKTPYFEKGTTPSTGDDKVTSDSGGFKAGDYSEGGQTRGHLTGPPPTTPPAAPVEEKEMYTYMQIFSMKGRPHELNLIVDLVTKEGRVDTIKQVIMMSSEAEELGEKIREEQAEIKKFTEASVEYRKKDLQSIVSSAQDVKMDVTLLAKNGELSEDTKMPELAALAILISNYGYTYGKKDLGVEDNPDLTPNCPKPSDIVPGKTIIFQKYKNNNEKTGIVIAIESFNESDGSAAYWNIKFRPKYGRSKTTLSFRAYDEGPGCKPNYTVPDSIKGCGTKEKVPPTDTTFVPKRYINGTAYYGYEKASVFEAVPLCWSEYQGPEFPLVGMDRLRDSSSWHRAHLLHGELGGKGIRANLIPTTQYINNVVFPRKYEDKLYKTVIDGLIEGDFYWFRAKVTYHDQPENFDLKHYDDFVKKVEVSFGIAEPLDDDHKNWNLTSKDVTRAVIEKEFALIPAYKDILSTRTDG